MNEATNPSDDRARERGQEIALRCKIVRDGELWLVPAPPGRSFHYRVALNRDEAECRCTCPEFGETWRPCCHIHAARFAEQRDRGQPVPAPVYPTEVPPGAPIWVTKELMRETYRVWHLHYPERLTPVEVLAMIVHVSRLCGD